MIHAERAENEPFEPAVEEWVEVTFEERRPKRIPSLPALNLVTTEGPEQVVDLLESPEHRYRGYGLETPWPHSPSGSVASLAAASTAGIYIVLE